MKANSISLNVDKSELVLFSLFKKQAHSHLKTKINEKRFYETDSFK